MCEESLLWSYEPCQFFAIGAAAKVWVSRPLIQAETFKLIAPKATGRVKEEAKYEVMTESEQM